MRGKDLAFLAAGSFSFLLANVVTSGFNFLDASIFDALVSFSVAFLLMFLGGVFWISTAVNIIKEL